MSAQKSLPIVYQMAILMGARVEVWHEEMWKMFTSWQGSLLQLHIHDGVPDVKNKDLDSRAAASSALQL